MLDWADETRQSVHEASLRGSTAGMQAFTSQPSTVQVGSQAWAAQMRERLEQQVLDSDDEAEVPDRDLLMRLADEAATPALPGAQQQVCGLMQQFCRGQCTSLPHALRRGTLRARKVLVACAGSCWHECFAPPVVRQARLWQSKGRLYGCSGPRHPLITPQRVCVQERLLLPLLVRLGQWLWLSPVPHTALQEAAQRLQSAMAGYLQASQQEAADILECEELGEDEPANADPQTGPDRAQAVPGANVQNAQHTPWQVCLAWTSVSIV